MHRRTMRGARGRERTCSTRTHPEPGRDPVQRRRVLWRRRHGRRGRRGRPASSVYRGVEQWQLVGLITQRSEVRILPPLPIRRRSPRGTAVLLYLTPPHSSACAPSSLTSCFRRCALDATNAARGCASGASRLCLRWGRSPACAGGAVCRLSAGVADARHSTRRWQRQ